MLGFCIFSWEKIGDVADISVKDIAFCIIDQMDDLIPIAVLAVWRVKDDLIFDSWIEKVLHERIDIVNAGLALVHGCQDLDISSRDLTAKGSGSDLFDHLRDVFTSGFEIRAVSFSFCEILRKLALANVSG